LPSYEVNIESCQQEGGCFPKGEKQPLEGSQPYVHLIWNGTLNKLKYGKFADKGGNLGEQPKHI
jgi:hypothetical protein